ncbi:MAG: hypothetical protein JW712_01195 [Dehalococcoidales bacterium]|nr:hypothetical protein [Dehalococcoidales bacterium]
MNSDNTPETGLLYRDELKGYDFGIGHPFRGDRYRIFSGFLSDEYIDTGSCNLIQADPATVDDLLMICEKDYIEFSMEYFGTGNLNNGIIDRFSHFHSGDNYPRSRPLKVEEAARYVIGQAKTACELVTNGDYRKVISIGGGLHHAKRAYGEGFCIYNDVAFCGLYLAEQCGLERILILDTDAHAGNGTAEYFYEDPRILFIDIHQDPHTLYPGTGFVEQTGKGKGEGYTINIPLPPGASDRSYEAVFDSVIIPVTREFNPQIVIQNGGSDPHGLDQLTNLNLSLDGFTMIGGKVSEMAATCDNRLIGLIASGYNMDILPYVWLSLISGLTGIEVRYDYKDSEIEQRSISPVYEDTIQVIESIKKTHGNYWNCLK